MMQAARRALLVVLLLLAPIATASAECAWVLWTYISVSGSPSTIEERWRPLGGFETQAACAETRDQMQKKRAEQTPRPGVRLVTHNCFPDTIDPRGPKAK